MLVGKAMLSDHADDLTILRDAASMPPTGRTTWPTTPPPCEATEEALLASWSAWRAFSRSPHRGGELLHGRGGLLQRAGRLLGAPGQAWLPMAISRPARRTDSEAVRTAQQHGGDLVHEVVEGGGDLRQLVLAAVVQAHGQVPLAQAMSSSASRTMARRRSWRPTATDTRATAATRHSAAMAAATCNRRRSAVALGASDTDGQHPGCALDL